MKNIIALAIVALTSSVSFAQGNGGNPHDSFITVKGTYSEMTGNTQTIAQGKPIGVPMIVVFGNYIGQVVSGLEPSQMAPGAIKEIVIKLNKNANVHSGDSYMVREGGRTVGAGQVTEIIK